MGVGSNFFGKSVFCVYVSTLLLVLALRGDGWGVQIPGKKHYVTLEWPPIMILVSTLSIFELIWVPLCLSPANMGPTLFISSLSGSHLHLGFTPAYLGPTLFGSHTVYLQH